MIDYLLCFPDKDTAIEFGESAGYTKVVETSEEVTTETAEGVEVIENVNKTEVNTNSSTHEYFIDIIGEHFLDTGEKKDLGETFGEVPIMEGDGKHWILFRDIKGNMPIPTETEQFIVWASNRTERIRRRDEDGKFLSDDPNTENDEAWETIPMRRPSDSPDRSFLD